MLEYTSPPQYNTPMSAEFMTDYPENTISAAVEKMNRTIRNFKHISEYVVEIQEAYASQPIAKAELFSMVRAAHLITGHPAGNFSEEVQAVYHGELLGLELLNNIEASANKHFKTGFAQAFVKHQLDKSHIETNSYNETSLQRQNRLIRLSRSIQIDLSKPDDDHQLNPLFEDFGQKVTAKLSDELSYQYFAMMGYRMILGEAIQPSFSDSTLEMLSDIKNPNESHTYGTDEDLEIQYVPTDAELMEAGIEEKDFDWEDITHFRKIFLSKYNQLELPSDTFDATRIQDLQSTEMAIEVEMNNFNQRHKLISEGDLLTVTGNFFALSNSEFGEADLTLFKQHTEIRGFFDGIHLVEVPSNRVLLQTVTDLGEYAKLMPKKFVHSLAIRIKNPVYIFELSDGRKISDLSENESINFPLIYRNVHYERIKATDLEGEV
ncbi:MAG: hypothetical protein JWN28_763 [Candidatus Saccharibacteria bacterium]|nr:hypothetical protein [Candidatus Saccharibacteria bacterium]